MIDNSRQPMRSQRLSVVSTYTVGTTPQEIRLERGTYRLAAMWDGEAETGDISVAVMFAIGYRDNEEKYFPAPTGTAPSVVTCLAEPLIVCGSFNSAYGWYPSYGYGAIEVDILDNQSLYLWSSQGGEIVKVVRVGDLPSPGNETERAR